MTRGARRNPYEEEDRAERYDQSVLIREDGIRRAREMDVSPAWSVLDIGAGPGTLALPLARRVRSVTAVEPSAAMRARLNAHLREEGLRNIRVVPLAWEDVDVARIGRHDLVIASYSLLMEDLEGALAKMDEAALRRVDLYWFQGTTAWEALDASLAPLIGREARPATRKSDAILALLEAAGIKAECIPLVDTRFPRGYAGIEEAVRDLSFRLGIDTSDHDETLAAYARENCIMGNGLYGWEDDTRYVRVSWRPVDRIP